MSECNPFITDDFVFPRRPDNRPALPRVDYRVAAYPEFVEAMLRSINGAVELRAWTHRAPDDPGIALLEGAAIVGDILTFYQERYANEAFLRTATWRDSVAALVRLLGYRLAPGVGGRATFAFEVKGTRPIEIPAEFPLKAELDAGTVDFLTAEACTAYSFLSRFNLYRARSYGASLSAGATRIEVKTVDASALGAAVDALGLKKGDRLLLAPPEPLWTTSGTSFAAMQKAPQIVKVKEVTRRLGRTIVELDAALAESWTLPVTAYRLGRSWRHFGHSAPAAFVVNSEDSTGTITGAREHDTRFVRHLDVHACALPSFSFLPQGVEIPLDQEVSDLVPGGRVVVQTIVSHEDSGGPKPLTVVKRIAALRAVSIGFARVTGGSTMLTMDSPLNRNESLSFDLESDIRDYQIHEITSAPIQLQPEATFAGGSFATGENALTFYGTLAQRNTLPGRRLLLQRGAEEPVALTCTSEVGDSVPAGAVDESRPYTLSFDRPPVPFTRADFDEGAPAVTVFGNLADATQGKAEQSIALGNGDARARFQTFRVPKAPLTYLLSAGATPPQAPELDVYVAGTRWARVDSFVGRGPAEAVYVVREDPDGASWVQFGDGETGARLPSGVRNVTAAYRTGNGAHGPVKAGATPTAGRRIEGLDKVQLPGLVTGGAEPEAGDRAREAAPGKIQSLGRMVSLRDYETELLAIPGVTTATAAWGLTDGVPMLTLFVLLESGREAEFAAIRATIQRYQRCRGPDRFAIDVRQAFLRYAYLDLQYGFDARSIREDVEGAIRTALGLAGDEAAARSGLFGLRNRRLGEREYATRVEGVVQRVAGVTWCRATTLGFLSSSVVDPAAAPLPAFRTRRRKLTPGPDRLIQLHAAHLTLASAPGPPPEECA